MTDLSDEELMLMFKYGRVEAFDLLFEKHRQPLYSFLLRMLGDRSAAEDLFQDVFIQVVRAAGRYEATARFSTWLFKIATNRCLNHLKSASHRHSRKTISLHADAGLADQLDSPDPQPGEQAQDRELADILHRVVQDLPDAQKAAFLLRETQGRPYDEIAEVLGQPLGTVKTNLHRARQTVRQKMRRYFDDL